MQPIETVRGVLSLGIAAPLDALLAEARAIRIRGLVATLAVLLVAIPLTGWVAHRVSIALSRITRQAEDIQAFRFDGPSAGRSPVLEIDQLSGAVDMMRNTIRNFLDITAALAAETDTRRLLDRVVSETSDTMGVAGGVAYLPDDDGVLEPVSLIGARRPGARGAGARAARRRRVADRRSVPLAPHCRRDAGCSALPHRWPSCTRCGPGQRSC